MPQPLTSVDSIESNPFETEHVRARVSRAVDEFLRSQQPGLASISPELTSLFEVGADFVSGGKRLRAVLAWWGWRGAGGEDSAEALRACSSLEFVQACALVHDDVMDDSDTRRGQPSVHRSLAHHHEANSWHGDPAEFGRASAILLGDLFLSWADQVLFESGLPAAALMNAKPIYDIMRSELMAGQYLDVVEQAKASASAERSLRVARYKSAKYTVERPLQLGASLAGGSPQLLSALSDFGLPLGEAFQLRDDVLGVFGDPSVTGKPAGDDIREGKQTYLIAETLTRGSEGDRILLRDALGDDELSVEQIDYVREIITDTGALAATEERISQQLGQALRALDSTDLANGADQVLRQLAQAATNRTS